MDRSNWGNWRHSLKAQGREIRWNVKRKEKERPDWNRGWMLRRRGKSSWIGRIGLIVQSCKGESELMGQAVARPCGISIRTVESGRLWISTWRETVEIRTNSTCVYRRPLVLWYFSLVGEAGRNQTEGKNRRWGTEGGKEACWEGTSTSQAWWKLLGSLCAIQVSVHVMERKVQTDGMSQEGETFMK